MTVSGATSPPRRSRCSRRPPNAVQPAARAGALSRGAPTTISRPASRSRPGRWRTCGTTSPRSSSALTVTRASPTCGTRRTSCSASASNSTSTSTSGRASSTTSGSARSRARARRISTSSIFRENTEGSYVGIGGFLKKGTPDEVAMQEEINTRKGVERIFRAAFEWAVGERQEEGADGRQVERHALRPRSLAARLRRGSPRSFRRSRPRTCSSTRSACRWCGRRSSSR